MQGLAAPEDGPLHPVQQAFHENHALQCGFCTPGFVMLLAGALEADPDLVDADEEALTALLASNLCRCTGYVGIRAAAHAAADVLRARSGKSPRRRRHDRSDLRLCGVGAQQNPNPEEVSTMATGETGFDDVSFDLISLQYHSLKAGHDYGQYVRDAKNAGLDEVAAFSEQVMQEDSQRAARCHELLGTLGAEQPGHAGRQLGRAWPQNRGGRAAAPRRDLHGARRGPAATMAGSGR